METIINIIITPIIFVMGLLFGVVSAIGTLIYTPIKFLLMFWGKDDETKC